MLGIDVSKQTLACSLLNPADQRVLWRREVANTPQGVQSLLQSVPAQVPWVMEPTGRYSLAVAKPAHQAGRQVLLAPAKRAKRFCESIQSRAKTDRLDSRGLALFALSQPLPAYPIKSETVEQLDQLLAARRGLAQALSSLEQRATDLPYAASALAEAIGSLKAQRQKLDEQIASLTADKTAYPHVERLQAVEGIGPVTAAAVASCLMARAFTHSDQFVAFVGLDIATLQSGRRKGTRGLTRQGDAELRRLLYCCAQAAVRSKSSPLRAQFERELAKGLSKTAAYCSVARKLARVCWSLVRHNTDYDPQRVFQQTKPSQQAEDAVEQTPA